MASTCVRSCLLRCASGTAQTRSRRRSLRWFGKTQEFELVYADVDAVGSRLHVWWRARLRAERLGEGWFVAEQHAYVDTDDESRINQVSLVCSGYVAE